MLRTALAAGLICSLVASGSAWAAPTTAPAPAPAAHVPGDPWEPLNRRLYGANRQLDHFVIRPLARGYQAVTPQPLRNGVRHALNNLGEPVTFINDVLQLHPKRAGATAFRFALNTTVGVVGLFDVADKMDVPINYEDFGQTLGRYGVGPGPYIFIPILGPSDLRDAPAMVVDWQTNPLALRDLHVSREARVGVSVLDGIDFRARIDPEVANVEATATDEYATVRSAFLQNRKSEIADGVTKVEDLPDFDNPPPASPPPATPPATPPKDPSQ